ncbi:MAG: hypothetical protein ABI818_06765, partial [Acidobacteriota bacterium]
MQPTSIRSGVCHRRVVESKALVSGDDRLPRRLAFRPAARENISERARNLPLNGLRASPAAVIAVVTDDSRDSSVDR